MVGGDVLHLLTTTLVLRAVQSPQYPVLLEEATRTERCLLSSNGTAGAAALRWSSEGSWMILPPSLRRRSTAAAVPSPTPSSHRYKQIDDAMPTRSGAGGTEGLLLHHPPRAVLIGATGFLGKFLAEELLAKGFAVTIVARDRVKAERMFQPIFSGEAQRRRQASKGYVALRNGNSSSSSAASLGTAHHHHHHVVEADMVAAVEGNSEDVAALRHAVHRASLVFYCASAARENALWPIKATAVPEKEKVPNNNLHSPESIEEGAAVVVEESHPHHQRDGERRTPRRGWIFNQNTVKAVDHDGALLAAKFAHDADAHFVMLDPLAAWGSWWSPMRLLQRCFAIRRGTWPAARAREDAFLQPDGQVAAWYQQNTPSLRFTMCRTTPLIFPSAQTHVLMRRSANLTDPYEYVPLRGTAMDARSFSQILLRGLCMHRSSVEQRWDVVGLIDRESTTMSSGVGAFFGGVTAAPLESLSKVDGLLQKL